MLDQADTQTFDDARPRLMGLAYRILGSRADAEDAVQDTFLKWLNADRGAIQQPAAWLTTACTRRCLDLLRAAHRNRVDYIGPWLPEPVQYGADIPSDDDLVLAASLKTAFLLMLERLSPKERAAYLLHEVFDTPYCDVAAALDIQENTCRKLVSRARSHVNLDRARHSTSVERQDQLLLAFQAAVTGGNTDALQALLSEDIHLTADGGGKVAAIRKPVAGRASVCEFIARLQNYWADCDWQATDLNGERGFILRTGGEVHATVAFAYDAHGLATHIFIMRNPEKLTALGETALH